MKIAQWLLVIVSIASLAAAFAGWRKVAQLNSALASLQAEHNSLQEENATIRENQSQKQTREIEKLRAEAQEVARLRNEVNQLRKGGVEASQLRAENERLRNSAKAATVPNPAEPAPWEATKDHFPKDSWHFAGYATPENTLVSAIWAMREGNPKTYLDSLSPEEQARMTKEWGNKSEAEIAAKHQQDVSSITGLRVLGQQDISPDQVVMDVYIEGRDGQNKMQKVTMKRMANDALGSSYGWKVVGNRGPGN